MNLQAYIDRDVRMQNLFRTLPRGEFRWLQIQGYKKGERLLTSGETPRALFIILSGICTMKRDTAIAYSQQQEQLGYLDAVGLYEIIHNIPRIGTIIAYQNCQVLVVDRKTVLRWVDEYPRFILEISTGIIHRLFKMLDYAGECTKCPAYFGVVSLLLGTRELFTRENPQNNGPVRITYTRQYIADMVGKDIRSVNRAIEQLKGKGLISVERGKILIDGTQAQRLQREKSFLFDYREYRL